MNRVIVCPKRVRFFKKFVALGNFRGPNVFIRLPNSKAARFCAAAIEVELRRSSRLPKKPRKK